MIEAQAQTDWGERPDAAPPPPPSFAYPVLFTVPYPARLSRWKTALRPALAIPQFVVVVALNQIAQLLSIVGWLSIVFSGQYDRTLWGMGRYALRWQARVLTYLTLLRDEYPPFGDGAYPAELLIPYPAGRRSRLRAFFRLVLVLPQFVVLYVLSIPLSAGVLIAWFAILITGRYPEGIWRLVAGLNRWLLRVLAYALLLRDEYPPFSLGLHEPATIAAQAADAEASWEAPSVQEDYPSAWPGSGSARSSSPDPPPFADATGQAAGAAEPSPSRASEEATGFTPHPVWRGWAEAAPPAASAPTLPGWPTDREATGEPDYVEDR